MTADEIRAAVATVPRRGSKKARRAAVQDAALARGYVLNFTNRDTLVYFVSTDTPAILLAFNVETWAWDLEAARAKAAWHNGLAHNATYPVIVG